MAFSSAGPQGRGAFFYLEDRIRKTVAKVTPGEFIRQVRSEASKVVWPTRRETMMTAVITVSRRVGQTTFDASERTCRMNSPGVTLATVF